MKIAVLGGGHGGYAAAVDLTLRGFQVALFTFSGKRIECLHTFGNRIQYEGVWGKGECQISCVTGDMKKALEGAALAVMNVPGTGHEKYLREMKKYLNSNTVLYMNPGHSGGALRAAKMLGRGMIAEANTLSYISRKTGEHSVRVTSADKAVTVGVFPAECTGRALREIRKVYPKVVMARDVLESSLCNINAMFHPPGMVLNAGWIEHTQGNFKFYYEGITPAIGNVIRALDRERLMTARAYGMELRTFCQSFYQAGSTTREAAAANDPYQACQESEGNKFIKAPDTLDHRYMHEDICSGLVPISELASLAGVAVPVTDALICAAEALMRRDYRAEGVNLCKMGLAGMSIDEVLHYVKYGDK